MEDNDGYIKTLAVMQKFFDQAISGNWSYNPENYDNGEVPVSVLAGDMLKTYKYGWKTSYYQNTYDFKTDTSVEVEVEPIQNAAQDLDPENPVVETQPKKVTSSEDLTAEDSSCEACEI
jgi:ribonucleoside-diphosphate reductase alpha chain